MRLSTCDVDSDRIPSEFIQYLKVVNGYAIDICIYVKKRARHFMPYPRHWRRAFPRLAPGKLYLAAASQRAASTIRLARKLIDSCSDTVRGKRQKRL